MYTNAKREIIHSFENKRTRPQISPGLNLDLRVVPPWLIAKETLLRALGVTDDFSKKNKKPTRINFKFRDYVERYVPRDLDAR